MAKQIIDTGAVANDNTGDTLREAMTKANSNFDELYTKVKNPVLANTILAGAASGSSTEPTFRTLVPADLPANVVTSNSIAGGAITLDKLASALIEVLIPTGAMLPYCGSSAPTSWLICDGTAVSRTTYATLFSIIGTTYGAGDGSTTFNLPDSRGRTIVAPDSSAGRVSTNNTLGASSGSETHTLTESEMPTHNHYSLMANATTQLSAGSWNGASVYYPGATTTGDTGGDQPHNNMQPYLVANYIIKH